MNNSFTLFYTEGEFCFARRKDFIPLKMQRGYTPDGWLGALLGARLFVEFSHKHPFEESIEDLKKRIRAFHTDSYEPETALSPRASIASMTPMPPLAVAEWSKENVEIWLKDSKL